MAETDIAHPAVHDQSVIHTARFTLEGRAVPTTQVRYFVGNQGPFTDTYDTADVTPELIQQGQLKQVHFIQKIGVPLPGPPVERITQEPTFTGGAPTPVPPKFRLGTGA